MYFNQQSSISITMMSYIYEMPHLAWVTHSTDRGKLIFNLLFAMKMHLKPLLPKMHIPLQDCFCHVLMKIWSLGYNATNLPALDHETSIDIVLKSPELVIDSWGIVQTALHLIPLWVTCTGRTKILVLFHSYGGNQCMYEMKSENDLWRGLGTNFTDVTLLPG